MSATIIRPNGEYREFLAVDYQFDSRVNLTQHPTERPVTDHAQRLPLVITVTAVIPEGSAVQTTTPVVPQARFDFLSFLESCVGESLILVTDGYGAFSGYMLSGWPHRLDGIKKSTLIITFLQVTQAQGGAITIPVEAPAASADSASFATAQDAGIASTTTATDTQEAGASSTLYSLIYGD